MTGYLVKRTSVEIVGAEELVPRKDVATTEGYFERRYYAFVGNDDVYVVKQEMTLRQVLQLRDDIKEQVRLFVSSKPIRTKEKEVVKEVPKRAPRAKRKNDEAKEEEA